MPDDKKQHAPHPDVATPVQNMPEISNPHSRQTLEHLGSFDYNKYQDNQYDFANYLELEAHELDEGSFYKGQWLNGERCGRGK